MSGAPVLPLFLAGAAVIGASLYFGGSGHAWQAPKKEQLARRNSELAFMGEGAAPRNKMNAEGHSGSGAAGPIEDSKRRESNAAK
mmetsp:Transcript_32964/g.77325  ORF Transcript_32964/g.77325 Transcript_32964/m.77325 type:complete len:85 (+) Transcript_32964:225-479(+)